MTHGSPARPTVVVLGGGYAGIQVARPLDDLADVVLVEPKDDFVHNVAALRALVDPGWLERIYLPYTGLLGRGRVVRDRAVKAGAGLLRGSPLRAGPPTAPGETGTFTVTTQAGDEVTADIWFRCYGVVPASDYLAGGLAAARRPDGFVEVTPELRVAGQDQVFALGDVSAADQNKRAGAAGRQAPAVAGNIRAITTGEGEQA